MMQVHPGARLVQAGSDTALSMLCLYTPKPTYRVSDSFMARLLANPQRPSRPPVGCIDVARHALGSQLTLLQEVGRLCFCL